MLLSIGAAALAAAGCGPTCRTDGAYTDTSSFEGSLDGWTPGNSQGPAGSWTIEDSAEQAVCGSHAVKFEVTGDVHPADLWVEKMFTVPPATAYQVNLDADLGTEDDGERMTPAGVRYGPSQLYFSARSTDNPAEATERTTDTYKNASMDAGVQWLAKPQQIDVPRANQGKIWLRFGIRPNTEKAPRRTYYVDNFRVYFRVTAN